MAVDATGVDVDAGVTGPVIVELDGQYVWSFVPARDGVRRANRLHTPWPPVLRPHLKGSSLVTVRGAADGTTHDEVEVRFDDSPGRVSVTDQKGHPVAVDKVGHLQRIFGESSGAIKEEILTGTARALRDLREVCGVEAYLNYGALLGAVRDGRMIGHDSDTDVCYLSRHTAPVDIISESYRVERGLKELGWNLLRMSGGDIKLLLPLSDGRNCHIDVFVAFFVAGRFYQLGNRSGSLEQDAILPLATIDLEGHTFPAPRDPEAMLAFLYGPHWRTPDPSFKYADPPEGVRRLDGWLRGFRTEMGPWNELYTGDELKRISPSGSPFSAWVRERVAPGTPIADLGCGAGSDVIAFHKHGHPVTGFDFSRAAVRRTKRRLTRHGAEPDVRKLILNELRTVLVAASELAHADRPYDLYARHLVGCLDEAARANLWLLATTALRRGGSLYLELAGGPPRPDDHRLVRRFDLGWLRTELAAHGLRIVEEETGPGTDMFGAPDPVVHRLVVRPGATVERPAPRRPRRWRVGSRLNAIEHELGETRQLQRRLAELLDVATELAAPLAVADPDQVEAVQAGYRASL